MDELYIVDAFGIRRSLSKARIILTESMFKCRRWLGSYCRDCGIPDPMAYYFDAFHTFGHAMYLVGSDLSLAGKTSTRLSYQMLNTLDMEESVFDSLVNDHIERAFTAPFYRGAPEPFEDIPDDRACVPFTAPQSDHANASRPQDAAGDGACSPAREGNPMRRERPGIAWREALKLNPEFINDSYVRERVMEERRSRIREAALGRVVTDGCDRYLSDDLLCFLIYMLRCTDIGSRGPGGQEAAGSPEAPAAVPGCGAAESGERHAMQEDPGICEEEAERRSSFAALKRTLIEHTLKPCCLKGNRFYLPDGAVLFKGSGAGDGGIRPWNRYFGLLRSPHLSRNEECAMRPFITPVKDTPSRSFNICTDREGHKTDIYSSYFSHLRGIVMVSYLSGASAALGGADYDGDIVKITADSRVNSAILKGAYREKGPGNFVRRLPVPLIISPSPVPERLPSLYMESASGSGRACMGRNTGSPGPAAGCGDARAYAAARPGSGSASTERALSKKYYERLFRIVYDTFSNRIGLISNAAIRISAKEYRSGEQGQRASRCALCTIITGLEIDAAKNGIHPVLPDWISGSRAEGAYDYPAVSRKLREDPDLIRDPGAFDIDDRGDSMVISKGGRKWMETVSGNGSNIDRLPMIFFRRYKDARAAESLYRARAAAGPGREHLYFSFQLEPDWEERVLSDHERLKAVRETVRAYARVNSLVFEHSKFEKLSSQYIRRAKYLLDVEYDRREAVAEGPSVSGAAEAAFSALCAALSEAGADRDPGERTAPERTKLPGEEVPVSVSGAAGAAPGVPGPGLSEAEDGGASMRSAAAGPASPPEAADPVYGADPDPGPESLHAAADTALKRLRELKWNFQPGSARAECLRKITGKDLGGAGLVLTEPFDDGYMLLFYLLNAVRYLPRTESMVLRDLGSTGTSDIYKRLVGICYECGIRKKMPRSTWQEYVRETCREELCRIFADTCRVSAGDNGALPARCGSTGYASGCDAAKEAAMEEALRYVYYLKKNREPGRADKFLWDIFDAGTVVRCVYAPEKDMGDRDCAGREA